MRQELLQFTCETLVPCANNILCQEYDEYCAGADIDVRTKSDGTPAGKADRKTEAALRAVIEARYPNHGIWGEEYGAVRIENEWLWVLDPLDGTREFLAKKPGYFGTLIGLFHHGQAVLGAISDPLSKKLWITQTDKNIRSVVQGKTLKDSVIACTNPEMMFATPDEQAFIERIKTECEDFKTRLNCMGFAKLADGELDAVIEADLSLHDLGALIPVLQASGKTVIDFEGNDYITRHFDLANAHNHKFRVIAAENTVLAQEILERRL